MGRGVERLEEQNGSREVGDPRCGIPILGGTLSSCQLTNHTACNSSSSSAFFSSCPYSKTHRPCPIQQTLRHPLNVVIHSSTPAFYLSFQIHDTRRLTVATTEGPAFSSFSRSSQTFSVLKSEGYIFSGKFELGAPVSADFHISLSSLCTKCCIAADIADSCRTSYCIPR
jgi:hypothetical protein